MQVKFFKSSVFFTMTGLFLSSACRQETTLNVRKQQEERNYPKNDSYGSNFAKERLSWILQTDLPESAKNIYYHAYNVSANDVIRARFDIPHRDLIIMMEQSSRLPPFAQLEQDNYAQFIRRSNLRRVSFLPWWDPVTLDKPLFTAIGGRMGEQHSAGSASQLPPLSTWQLHFITSELSEKGLIRVYVRYMIF